MSTIRQPLRVHNPAILLPRLPTPPIRGVVATPEEVERAIQAAPPALKLMLILAHDSALRYAEAASISRLNWNRESHSITFKGKGGYTRTVPVSVRAEHFFELLD